MSATYFSFNSATFYPVNIIVVYSTTMDNKLHIYIPH